MNDWFRENTHIGDAEAEPDSAISRDHLKHYNVQRQTRRK